MNVKYLLFLLLACIFMHPFPMLSQDVSGRNEAIEAMKVSFFTKRLNLTPAEAQAFWPVYNQYEAELTNLRKSHKKQLQETKEDFANISDREIESIVDAQILFRQQEIDILRKYHTQFKKTLPVKKVAMLYKAEEDFKRYLIQQIKSK